MPLLKPDPTFYPSPRPVPQQEIYRKHPTGGLGFDSFSTPSLLTCSIAVHTLGYLLVTGLLAVLVYEKLGVGILRRAWFNVDLIWMLALMITGLSILIL